MEVYQVHLIYADSGKLDVVARKFLDTWVYCFTLYMQTAEDDLIQIRI